MLQNITEIFNNLYTPFASTINYCFNNKLLRSSAITFLSTLSVKREGEHHLAKFVRAASMTSLQWFNDFLKDQDIVDNDNLVYSSNIGLVSYFYSPAHYANSHVLITSTATFALSYAGFEYIHKNEVNYFQLADHALDVGATSGSGFITYRLLGQFGVTNPLTQFSISVPIAATIAYQVANLENKSYDVLNSVFPVNETAAEHQMFKKFSNETDLHKDISKLAHNTIQLGFAIGLLHNLNSVDGARLAHNIF